MPRALALAEDLFEQRRNLCGWIGADLLLLLAEHVEEAIQGFADNVVRNIEALAASGITSGCGGTSYCPDNPVTRGQMAAFLVRALGL